MASPNNPTSFAFADFGPEAPTQTADLGPETPFAFADFGPETPFAFADLGPEAPTQTARREPPELRAATPMTPEDLALGEARRDVRKKGEKAAYEAAEEAHEESTRKNLRDQGFSEPMISAMMVPGGETLDRAITLTAPIAGNVAGTMFPVAGPTTPYIAGGGAAALADIWVQLREHARSGATKPFDFKKGRFAGQVLIGAVIPGQAKTLAPGMRAAQVIETGTTLGGQMAAISAGESALRQLGDEGTIDFRELAKDTGRGAQFGATLGTTFSTASQIYKNLKLKNAKGIEGYSPSEIGTQIALRGGGGVGGFAYGWSSNPELPFDKRLENALLWASASGGLAPTVIFKAIKKVRGSGPAKTKVFADWQDAMNREYGPGTVPEVSDKLAYPEWKAAMTQRHGDNPYLDEVWDIIQLRKSEAEARTPAGKAKLAEEAAIANKAKLAEEQALAAEQTAAAEALAARQARAEEALAAERAAGTETPGVPRRPIIDESEADLARRKINEDFGNNAGESAAVFEAAARSEEAAARAAEELAATTARNLEPAANIARTIEAGTPVKSAEESAEVMGAAEARETARLAREAALDAGGFTAAKERARIEAQRNEELTPRSQLGLQGAAASAAILDEANADPDESDMRRNLRRMALGAVVPSLASKAPTFYSRLTRTVEQFPQSRASGAQWKGTIRNSKLGVNQDEFALAKVDDLQGDKIYTKAEVLEYLRANEVVVKDVTLGGPTKEEWIVRDKYGSIAREGFTDKASAEKGVDASNGEYADVKVPIPHALGEGTHFSGYQLPGAKKGSYREVLLTVPVNKSEPRSKWEVIYPGNRRVIYDNYAEANKVAGDEYLLNPLTPAARWRDGHPEYSQHPNPIVRLRYNERTTADGKRMLFLEELQPPKNDKVMGKGNGQFEKMPELFQKNWREMAFKWAMRKASDEGFDSVGWTTGEQQAARYSLEKRVRGIEWTPIRNTNTGVTHVIVDTPSGLTRFNVNREGMVSFEGANSTGLEGKALSDVLGKEVAAKIMAASEGKLSGDGLKIGGEGLKKLYDSDFRNVVNNLSVVKKSGQKVGTAELKAIKDPAPSPGTNWDRIEARTEQPATTVHALTITPAIRESAMQGQPMFSVAAGAAAVLDEANADPDDNEMLRNLKWLALGVVGGKSPRVLKAIAKLSAKKTLSKQEAVKMWEYANGLLEQAKLRGTDMFSKGKGQMEGIISGLESVPVFKQLKDVVKYIGNYADAVPVIPKGLRVGTPLGFETAVEALKNHTVAEGTAYKKAFPNDQSFYVGNIVNFTNPSFQEAALLRYGRYLTESEIKLIHIYSALGSGNATPVVDTALGFKVFDEMMRTGKGTGYGERPKQAYASSAPGKVRKPIYIDSKTGLDTFQAKGNEPKIHPLHKSKISKTFVVSGADNFNRILEHFDDDLDVVMTWLGSRHSFDDIKKVIGPEAAKGLKTHEYLNKSGESFGVFALGNNPKQGSYILNRWQELGTITKDMWVARTMSRYFREKNTGIPWKTTEAGNYKRGILEEAWSRAAKELNLKPAELQELMWAAERRIYERMGQKKGASYTSGWADSAVAKLEPFTTETPLMGRSGVMAAHANAPTDFPGVLSQMSSPEQARFRKLAEDLAPNAVIYDAAGEWNGGAANSLILAFEKIRSPSKLRELAASMGSARDQRAVPLWYINAAGDDAVHQIQWGKGISLADARQSMIDVGLNDRNFIQTPEGVKTFLLDPSQKNLAAVQKLKTHESSPTVDSRPATVEFLGGNLREEGRQAYRQVLGLAESRRGVTKLGTAGAREVGADSLSTPESRARAISESRFHVSSERGGYFEGAIARTARDHPMGPAVEVKSLEFYRDPSNTLYLSADGLAGVAVKPDGDLVSVFKHPTSTARVGEILADASKIATKLDAFDIDGFLPILYSKHGFRPVARVPFNDAFAPPGWNVDTMGRPDVVLMVKDVGNRLGLPDAINYNDLIRNRVPVVDYDRAMQLQQGALDDLRALNRGSSKSGTSTLWSPRSTGGFSPKSTAGFSQYQLMAHLGGGAGGFAAGWSANSELPPDKRLEKALMWAAAAGGLGPAALFKAVKLAQGSGPAKIPRAKLDPKTASLDDLRNIFIHEAEQSPSLLARFSRATELLQDRHQPLTDVEEAILGSRPQGLTLGDRASLIGGAAGKAEAALTPLIELRKKISSEVDDLDVSTFLFLRRTMDRLELNKSNAATYAYQQANHVFGPPPVAPTPRDVGTFTEAIVRQKMGLLQAKLGNNNLLALDALGAEFQKLSDSNLQTLVDAGRLSKADRATIKADNDFYAPFKVMKYMSALEGVKGTGRAIDTSVSVIKAIKGIKDEDIQLGDIMLAMGENTLRTHVLAEKNRVMLALAALADADPTGKYIQRVAPHKSPPSGFVGVNYMKDGSKLELAVLEPVARAVKGLNEQQLGVVGEALRNSAAVFRLGTVGANIGFQLVNFSKDQKRFAEISKFGFTSMADFHRYPMDFSDAVITSWKSNILGKKNQLYLDFMKSGSAGSTIAETLAPSAFRSQASVFNPISYGIEWSARIGKAIEETTKIMGYKRGARLEGLEKLTGADRQKALDRIAFEVRNFAGSPDFNKHGTLGVQMNILFMFANARMQGTAADMRRLSGRTGGREAVSAMSRLAVGTGLPTLALWYYNQQGDNLTDYESLSKREKTNNWMIPQYGADGKPLYFINEEGYRKREYIKLPKTDILAQVALITEGVLNFAKDQDPKAAMEAGQSFLENMSPINISGRNYQERVESIISGLNPILKTPLEFSTGRDTFRHQPIVPRRLENAPANLQFKDSTHEVFKDVANQMSPDASPLQLQRAVENMTGGLATQFMRPEQPGRSLLVSSPFFGRFFGSPAESKEKEWEIVNQWSTKATGESVVRDNAIRAIVNNMGKQPEAQTGRDLYTLIKGDPKSIPSIISALKDKSAGTTAIDKALKSLPSKDRAGAMMDMLGTFKTPEEKSEYLESMVRRGVITKDVLVEMRSLMKKP